MHVFANWIKNFQGFDLSEEDLRSVGYGNATGYTDLDSALHGSASGGLAGEMQVGNTLVFYRPAVGLQPEARYMLLVSGGRRSLDLEFQAADRQVLLDPGPGKILWCMADADPWMALRVACHVGLSLNVKAGHFLNSVKGIVHESVKTRYLVRIYAAQDTGNGNIIRLSRTPITSGEVADLIRSDILLHMLGRS